MSVRTATSSTARTHKKQLRDVLPPLALLYLFEKWLPTAPPKAEMQAALGALRAHLVVSSCDSVYYLADVVRVVCTLALQLEPATATVPLPHPSNPNPPVDARSLTVRISTLAYNRYALTLYLHGVYLEAFRSTIVARAAALGTGGGGTCRLKQIVTQFSAECKFTKTSDLFIWCVLYLKLPAWLGAAREHDERPYHLAATVFGDGTNAEVQPLIKESVPDQLLAATNGHVRFCIVAALILELTGHVSCDIAINHEVLRADPTTPTFAAVRAPYTEDDSGCVFGYVHHHTFFTFNDCYDAVSAWAQAVDATSMFAEVCCDDRPLSLGNVYAKFLSDA